MLHDRISLLRTWETEADIGFALFIVISLLAFATGGSGVVSAAQAAETDDATLLMRTKRFARYGAAAGVVLGILTVVQNTALPADYGTLSTLGKRAKRLFESMLSVLDNPLPTDQTQRMALIVSLTKGCNQFDDLERQLKHGDIAQVEQHALVTGTPTGVAHAAQRPAPWTNLADEDKLCFLGFGVDNDLDTAREDAARSARRLAYDFLVAEAMKRDAPFKDASDAGSFVVSTGQDQSGVASGNVPAPVELMG